MANAVNAGGVLRATDLAEDSASSAVRARSPRNDGAVESRGVVSHAASHERTVPRLRRSRMSMYNFARMNTVWTRWRAKSK